MEEIFVEFCSFGSREPSNLMDGQKFSKLVRECALLDKNLTPMDVDVIFTKCKPPGERKIDYRHFLVGLELLAAKKYPSLSTAEAKENLERMILHCGGPARSGTKATYESHLTDTSLYTGAHKARFDEDGKGKGKEGRTLHTAGVSDLSQITRPNLDHATAGMSNLSMTPSRTTPSSSLSATSSPDVSHYTPGLKASPSPLKASPSPLKASPSSRPSSAAKALTPRSRPPENMEDLFVQFCTFGDRTATANPMIDGTKFAKLCRDCGLLDKRLTATEVDLIFNKVKPRTERKLDFDHFLQAFELIAEQKFGPGEDGLHRTMQLALASHGPLSSGTQADYNGHLTDANLYTGAHRERFDPQGKGKGKEGRTLNTAGVSDLSQITRPNLGPK